MDEIPRTNTVAAEQALRARFAGDGFCHSYPPTTNSSGKRIATASIPINRHSMRKSVSEYRMAQDEAEADYKDFLFFSRVVDGISKQNSSLKDGSYLKSTNETLLDNIVRARHELDEKETEFDGGYHSHYYYPSGCHIDHDMKIVTPVTGGSSKNFVQFSDGIDGSQFQNHHEDEGIFHLEL